MPVIRIVIPSLLLEYVGNVDVCIFLPRLSDMEGNSSAADDHFADGIAHGGETLLIFSHDIIAHQILILMEVKGANKQLPAGSFCLL